MIIHIVLLKVADNVITTDIDEILESLGNLRYSTIPQIQEFYYGENNSQENLNRGYNYGFTIHFLSSEDRDYYLYHPDHIKIANQLIRLLPDGEDSVLVIDF
jgi:hypothetical protein